MLGPDPNRYELAASKAKSMIPFVIQIYARSVDFGMVAKRDEA